MPNPEDVRRALRPDTIAISIRPANSEVGPIQPVRAIGALARDAGVPFHVDAVQTFGKVEVDVHAMNIDALSFSSHKIYGPKGIAGLYIRRGTKMVSIQHGGCRGPRCPSARRARGSRTTSRARNSTKLNSRPGRLA